MCFFHYKHEGGHKIIDINEIKSLEDNGISYKETVSEFDKLFKKMNSIQTNIEYEIEKKNKSRDKLLDEITKSFEKQRTKLNEKENALKSELDIKITEIKEKLENYYIKINEISSSFKRIFKAMQSYEKNNNNKIKTLCYISKINKVNIEAKNIIKAPFKNTEIIFRNDNTLKYNDYYINGIPTPKDIKINQEDNKLLISWKIDNLYLFVKGIKYLITLKDKETELKYESLNTNIIIQDFKIDTEYEIKINAVVDEINGDCSEIIKFRTNFNPFKDVQFNRNINNNYQDNPFFFLGNNPFFKNEN